MILEFRMTVWNPEPRSIIMFRSDIINNSMSYPHPLIQEDRLQMVSRLHIPASISILSFNYVAEP